ncbi:MAG: hypothetical protein RLZZ293_1204 [Pseudomonadota bacterium]
MNDYIKLDWNNQIAYIASEDIYFTPSKEHCSNSYQFWQQNNLTDRIRQLSPEQNLVIAELGFGYGLNLFTAMHLWEVTRTNSQSQLHYLAFAPQALSPVDLAQILDNFPELADYSAQFLAQYYLILPGFQRLQLSNNVYITLIIGALDQTLPQLTGLVDFWCLTQFDWLNKNYQLANCLAELARRSKINTTEFYLTTNEQLSSVNLIEYGFELIATTSTGNNYQFKHITTNLVNHQCQIKPYYNYPPNNLNVLLPRAKQIKVAIIGAGISGAATAYSLAKRGFEVHLFEAEAQVANQASGNYQGILYGTFSAFGGVMMDLSCTSYRYSNYLIKSQLNLDEYGACGLIQLSHNPAQAKRNQQLAQAGFADDFLYLINQQQIEQLAQSKLVDYSAGIYFPHGLWLKPRHLVSALLNNSSINLVLDCLITQIKYSNNFKWELFNSQGKLEDDFDHLIFCNAYGAAKLLPELTPFLRRIRGQTTNLNLSKSLVDCVVCGDGYITPSSNNLATIGATFQFDQFDSDLKLEDHQQNLTNLSRILAEFDPPTELANLTGKAALRVSSFDYLPLVGPLAIWEQFKQDYAKLSQDKNARINTPCSYYPNLWLNIGHGAKGLLTAPLSGEIIADYIQGTPLPCSEEVRLGLHPNRLYVRQLVKRQDCPVE